MNTKFKILLILLIFNSQLSTLNSFAQSKFGHVDYGEIMKNMPGIDSAQTVMINFRNDLQATAEHMSKEFQDKQAELEKLASGSNTSQAILKIKQDDLLAVYKRIQEFSQSTETEIADKQMELLEPFQTKLLATIKKIAKADSYNYVFDISTLLFYAPGDDLTNKVKAELGIK
jgi:outer membrane protein